MAWSLFYALCLTCIITVFNGIYLHSKRKTEQLIMWLILAGLVIAAGYMLGLLKFSLGLVVGSVMVFLIAKS